MKRNRGFSVVELLMAIAILSVIIGVLSWIARSSVPPKDGAEFEARQYAKSLGVEINGVSCTGRGDNYNYSSCSISYKENGKFVILPVECSIYRSVNSGCRIPKQVVVR